MSGEFPQVAQKKHVDGETPFLDNDTWVICHFLLCSLECFGYRTSIQWEFQDPKNGGTVPYKII